LDLQEAEALAAERHQRMREEAVRAVHAIGAMRTAAVATMLPPLRTTYSLVWPRRHALARRALAEWARQLRDQRSASSSASPSSPSDHARSPGGVSFAKDTSFAGAPKLARQLTPGASGASSAASASAENDTAPRRRIDRKQTGMWDSSGGAAVQDGGAPDNAGRGVSFSEDTHCTPRKRIQRKQTGIWESQTQELADEVKPPPSLPPPPAQLSAPAATVTNTTDTSSSRRKTRSALLGGLRSGKLEEAVAKMEADESSSSAAAAAAPELGQPQSAVVASEENLRDTVAK
jgi:hypothetical protein